MTSTDLARPGDSPTILKAMKVVHDDPERVKLGLVEYDERHPAHNAYKALEDGRTLINLAASMTHAYELAEATMKRAHPNSPSRWTVSQPPLAVCHVDTKQIVCQFDRDGELFFGTRFTKIRTNLRGEFYSVRLPRGGEYGTYLGIAEAPAIPPHVRQLVPAVGRERHYLLWEPRWRTVQQSVPRMAFDPALLEHLEGELFAVIAAWDLTEIEKAVLAGGPMTAKQRRS